MQTFQQTCKTTPRALAMLRALSARTGLKQYAVMERCLEDAMYRLGLAIPTQQGESLAREPQAPSAKKALAVPGHKNQEYAARLRDIRRRLGRTQASMAGILGIAPETLSRYERGARVIPKPIMRLAISFLQHVGREVLTL